MSRRSPASVAFSAVLTLAAVTVVFAVLNRPLTDDLGSLDSVDFVYVVASVFFALISATLGLVVAARTRHPIGWLLLAFGTLVLVPLVCEQYAFYGLVTSPNSLPGAKTVAWVSKWSWGLQISVLVFILMLFPTGRPQSPRWRPIVAVTPPIAALWTTSDALQPTAIEWHEQNVVIPSGFGLDVDAIRVLPGIVAVLVIGLFLVAIASLAARFRRSQGVERQQVKWLAHVALIAGIALLAIIVANVLAAGTRAENAVGSIGWGILVTIVLLGLPLAIGASILRYRLYDIDRIISRTLSYALVTAVLAAAFALVVLVPPAVVGAGGRAPDWLVAVATLAVAALFRPVRRRVQNTIDHRFNRKRYDAARTIESFAGRLRDEVDIATLRTDLEALVRDTMQPSHVSLWLRDRPT